MCTSSFYPDPIGVAPLAAELAANMVDRGNEVTVATAFPHYPQWSIPLEYRRRLWTRETWNGAVLLRTWLCVSRRGTSASKFLYYSTFAASATAGSLAWGNPDLLFTISPPLSLSMTTAFARARRRCRAILWVCDLLPDTAVSLGMIKNKSLIRALYAFERWSYRQFDHIVVVSNAFREKLLAKGVPEDKISVLYTWVDTDFVRPLPSHNVLRSRNHLDGKFVVLYSGNIGLSQGLEVALKAAKILQRLSDIQFVIVGDGTRAAALRQEACEMGLSNVTFLPLQPRQELPQLYAMADVSLVLQRSSVLDINLPGKLQTILASGRPIINSTHPQGEVRKIVQQSSAGLSVSPEEPSELAAAIVKLYSDAQLRRRLGANGRDYALQYFSRGAALDAFSDLFRKTLYSPIALRPEV